MTHARKPGSAGSRPPGEDDSSADHGPSLSDVAAELGVEITPEDETPAANPFAEEEQPTAVREAYRESAAGAATRMFMDNAGLFSRQRQHRLSATLAVVLVAILATAIGLDLAGFIEIPGMGMMYDVSGVVDPNRDRAISRTKNQLRSSNLSKEESEVLRRKLLGLNEKAPPARVGVAPRAVAPVIEKGIEDKPTLSETERDLAANIFADTRKAERKVELTRPSEIQAPNLPEGLTAEAIAGVIQKNHRSMSLCIAKGMKAGESIAGKMEVEITIAAAGRVIAAKISSPEFNGTALGNCTVKTVKRWRFPRFDGKPVTVQFPYVLSAGL